MKSMAHACGAGRGVGNDITGATCPGCCGYGWVWEDGTPPTLCPGGGADPLRDIRADFPDDDAARAWAAKRPLPCGRAGPTCAGCDRHVDAIGGADDVTRTLAWRAP